VIWVDFWLGTRHSTGVACKDGHALFATAARGGETQRTRTEPTEWHGSVFGSPTPPLAPNLSTPTLHGQRTPRRPLNTVQLYLLWYQAKGKNSALIMHGLFMMLPIIPVANV